MNPPCQTVAAAPNNEQSEYMSVSSIHINCTPANATMARAWARCTEGWKILATIYMILPPSRFINHRRKPHGKSAHLSRVRFLSVGISVYALDVTMWKCRIDVSHSETVLNIAMRSIFKYDRNRCVGSCLVQSSFFFLGRVPFCSVDFSTLPPLGQSHTTIKANDDGLFEQSLECSMCHLVSHQRHQHRASIPNHIKYKKHLRFGERERSSEIKNRNQ